jgi:hypothetical protein
MRRDRNADNGLNEFMIASVMQNAPSLGVRRVSLNFAVFRDALERGERIEAERHEPDRRAVYGSTEDDPAKHFLGWADEVDADELFASGRAWGISVLRRPA